MFINLLIIHLFTYIIFVCLLFRSLIGAILKCFYTNTQSKASQKHNNFIFKYVNNNKATSFDLQSHHQAILNHISIGTLSGSAHLWDPKMFILIKIVGIKVMVAIKYVNR